MSNGVQDILFALFVLICAAPLLFIFIGALMEDAGVISPGYDHGPPKIVDPYEGWPMPIEHYHPVIENTIEYPIEEDTLEMPVVKKTTYIDMF